MAKVNKAIGFEGIITITNVAIKYNMANILTIFAACLLPTALRLDTSNAAPKIEENKIEKAMIFSLE